MTEAMEYKIPQNEGKRILDEASARLAVVSQVTEEGIKVQFEGESEPSSKSYPQLQSCNCIVGERVLMLPVSGSYVVIGVVDRKSVITASRAESVDNKAANIANIEFYYATAGRLRVKTTNSSSWYEFSGTKV